MTRRWTIREEPRRWWSWPPPEGVPVSEWDYETASGYSACPINVGVGPNYRTLSDEDWVEGMLHLVSRYGEYAFWIGFIDLLRVTYREFYNNKPYPPLESYPEHSSPLRLPLPNVAICCDDEGWSEQDWPSEKLNGMRHNPVFAGVPPFPALIARDAWCQNITGQRQENSLVQRLVNVLFCLRRTYGCPAMPQLRTPLGYRYDPEAGLFFPA